MHLSIDRPWWVFLFLFLIIRVEGFGRHRAHKKHCKSSEEDTTCRPLTDSNETCECPHSNCGIPGFGIIQKIPYLPSQSTCGPIDVQFSSACVRCGLCIAIAEQMNQTLIETHDLMSPEEWLDEGEASALLRSVCDYSFKHYSLREIDGKNYICDRMPGANLVPSTADGLWEKNLREKCNEFLDEMGPFEVYKFWRGWCDGTCEQDFVSLFCRNDDGIFRDCRSIRNMDKPDVPARDYHANMKVTVEFKCR